MSFAIRWDFKLCIGNFLQAIFSDRRVILPPAVLHRGKQRFNVDCD